MQIEILRKAVVGYDWADHPLTLQHVNPVGYHEFYELLVGELHQRKVREVAKVEHKLDGKNAVLSPPSFDVHFSGQGKYGRDPRGGYKNNGSSSSSNPIFRRHFKEHYKKPNQKCFNCNDVDCRVNICPQPLNLSLIATREMEYYERKNRGGKGSQAAKSVLLEFAQAFGEAVTESDASKDKLDISEELLAEAGSSSDTDSDNEVTTVAEKKCADDVTFAYK